MENFKKDQGYPQYLERRRVQPCPTQRFTLTLAGPDTLSRKQRSCPWTTRIPPSHLYIEISGEKGGTSSDLRKWQGQDGLFQATTDPQTHVISRGFNAPKRGASKKMGWFTSPSWWLWLRFALARHGGILQRHFSVECIKIMILRNLARALVWIPCKRRIQGYKSIFTVRMKKGAFHFHFKMISI